MGRRALGIGILSVVCLVLPFSIPHALADVFPFLHTRPHPLRGVVTQVSSRSLQIQTTNDTVSIPLTRRTQVFRVATGSLADLKAREIVTVYVTPGTTDVQQVVVSPQMVNSHHDRRGDRHRVGQRPLQPSDPGVYRNVQIVSLAGNKLQVRDDHGSVASFPIDNNTKVIKILRGTWHDLAVGESVLVFQYPDGSATSVKILSS